MFCIEFGGGATGEPRLFVVHRTKYPGHMIEEEIKLQQQQRMSSSLRGDRSMRPAEKIIPK
jgi:hypothetical protein